MSAPPSLPKGLSSEDAAARLRQFGPNVLAAPQQRGLAQIAFRTLREPMFLLLLVAALLYLLFGDLGEGLFLAVGAGVSLGLVVVQEVRSERALAALNALAEPVATVVRDDAACIIGARDIVPGDLLVLGEGGRVPADAWLVSGDALEVDESTLTGEAAAVTKLPTILPAANDPTPGEPNGSALFAGTMIVRGQGQAFVQRTGSDTQFGRIGTALASVSEAPTLLQTNLRALIGRLGILAIAFCAVVALAYGLIIGDWRTGALAGLTLAISLLPEEFPMVLAVFMALGAWRLAKHNVLVRRSAAIETLGATTLLCVDKTGTLTENKMLLAKVWRQANAYEVSPGCVPNAVRNVLEVAQMASAVRPHDPMDTAIHAVCASIPNGDPVCSFPLKPGFLAFVQVWQSSEGFISAAKGAPETIIDLCRLDAPTRAEVEQAVTRLGTEGMRVLAVAQAELAGRPSSPTEGDYRFEGLICFLDPVRADVPAALREARRAGVSVAMITGDYPATALAIARQAGIDTDLGAVTGAELDELPPSEIASVRVFARVKPDQKLALVQAFRTAGHVVAMTGDGVNDGPALATADIGIAMGRRGTDVAREASDLILLDDRFSSIIGGIRLGRRIFANLRQAMIFIAAIHVPIAGLALVPILIGLPPMLFPMHVMLLELLIDPLCSLAFEGRRSDADAMSRPPRQRDESLFGRAQILLAGMEGLALLLVTLALYWGALEQGWSAPEARASAFAALVLGNLSLAAGGVSAASSRLVGRGTRALWILSGTAMLILGFCLYWPPLAEILDLRPRSGMDLALACAIGIVAGAWYRIFVGLKARMTEVSDTGGFQAAGQAD